MLLNDKTISRSSLFEGLKLATHQQHHAISLCRFGQAQSVSLVTVGQNLDKLLVYDLAALQNRLMARTESGTLHRNHDQDPLVQQQQQESAVSYITIREQVIQGVTVIEIKQAQGQLNGKDLLLICCNASIMVYDTFNQEHLFSINTSSKITTISAVSSTSQTHLTSAKLLFCGGIQKLYAYQLDCAYLNLADQGQTQPLSKLVSFELLNERTISETVSCLIHGHFLHLDCLVVGFNENKIKVYSVDSLDQTIQTCQLTLAEAGKITCLSAIETVQLSEEVATSTHHASATSLSQQQQNKSILPSISAAQNEFDANQKQDQVRQMNYFAYGLETGFVGVYRLLAIEKDDIEHLIRDDQDGPTNPRHHQLSIFAERLWRHKSKQTPVSLSLFDMDGDGLDELIVGYRNGRLEVRSPFTGQLITSFRCFKSSGQLVGLVRWSLEIDALLESVESAAMNSSHETDAKLNGQPKQTKPAREASQDVLLACSSLSSLVAFRPQQRRPRQPLTDHLAHSVLSQRQRAAPDDELIGPSQYMSAGIETAASQSLLDDADTESDQQHQLIHDDEDDARAQSSPISCESRQAAELLQELGLMKRRQAELKQRLRQVQRELLCKQMASSRAALEYISASGAEQSGLFRMTKSWSFDATTNQLLLTLTLDSVAGSHLVIEMIEIVDISKQLISDGHLLLNPAKMAASDKSQSQYQRSFPVEQQKQMLDHKEASGDADELMSPDEPVSVSVDLVLGSCAIEQHCREQVRGQNRDDYKNLKPIDEPVELRLNVYLGGEEHSKRVRKRSASPGICIRNVYELNVVLPKFAMFVPESLVSSNYRKPQTNPMIRKAFVMPERTNKLQILDWLHSNFLCFQFGQIIDQTDHAELHNDDDKLWAPDQEHRLDAINENMELGMQKFSSSSNHANSTNTKTRYNQDEVDEHDGGFEFVFVDLRTIDISEDKQEKQQLRRLRIKLIAYERQLILASDDSDLLVDLIQSLVVDRLQLSVRDHSVKDKHQQGDGVEVLLNELSSINENSKQLEESERRIQMEIYESAELIKSLMQQMSIANELQEFGIARELLNETSMMLDGTHNSAQAYYLNNRSRLNLMKQANCLREKVLFLTGNGDETMV